MKVWVQLINGMKSKQGLMVIIILTALLIFGFAWHKDALSVLFIINIITAFFIGCIYSAWFIWRYGSPHWLESRKRKFLQFIQQIKKYNWHMNFQRKARSSNIPWFLVMGPLQSGKTSLLRASGCHYNIISDEETSFYEQWFANEAVMVNSAGLLLKDDADKQWKFLITKLKKSKIHTKLRSIILIINTQLLFVEEPLKTTIDVICKRIDELYTRLGTRLPIDILITQCDKLEGFKENFLHLDHKDRQQEFGIALNNCEDVLFQISSGLDQLRKSISARIFKQIHLQRSQSEKAGFLKFLFSFQHLQNNIQSFISLLTRDSIYQEKMNISGLYFTSAGDKEASQQGFFIHDFFKNRLFTRDISASKSSKKQKQLRRYQHVQIYALILLTLTGVGVLVSAYVTNSKLLQQGKQIAEMNVNIPPNHRPLIDDLSNLEAIGRHVYNLRHFKESHSWYQNLGMDKASSQQDIYEDILGKKLGQTLYRPVIQSITKDLHDLHQQWHMGNDRKRASLRGLYYSKLKLYLMLIFPQHIDLDFASPAMALSWQQMVTQQSNDAGLSDGTFLELSRTYLDYLRQLDAHKRHKLASYNARLIAEARHDLITASGVQNVFAVIESQYIAQSGNLNIDGWSDFDLWENNHSLPHFYTRNSYEKIVKALFLTYAGNDPKKDWVIHTSLTRLSNEMPAQIQVQNNKEQSSRLLYELNAIYFQNYLNHWLSFITSMKLIPFSSYEDASQQLRTLMIANGPLVKAFKVFNENLSLQQMLTSDEYNNIPSHVQSRMEELETLTHLTGNNNSLLMHYQKQLEFLQQDIEQLSIGQEVEKAAQNYASRILKNEDQDTALYKASVLIEQSTNPIHNLANRQAIKSFLLSPLAETYRIIVNEATRGLQTEWQREILEPYQERLANHFPFNHHGQDANLAEFSTFFRPENGIFAVFRNKLSPFLKRSGDQYVPISWLGISFPFSRQFLHNLEQVSRFSESLFPNGTGDISLRYAIYPIPAPGIKEILFVSNGQSYPYRNGPQEWVPFIWPGQDAMDNETFIRITQTFADSQASKEFQGAWGLFHLLVSASQAVKTDRGYRLHWVFRHGENEKTIQLLLTAKSATDPFEFLIYKPLKLENSLISLPS